MIPSGQTILVVEDNLSTRERVAAVLTQAGYRVQTAVQGEEALEFLRGDVAVDLILLDMLLPVVDGWRLLEEIQKDPRLATVPVIIATGTVLSREWALSHGCAGFLRKPFDAEDVLTEVRRCTKG